MACPLFQFALIASCPFTSYCYKLVFFYSLPSVRHIDFPPKTSLLEAKQPQLSVPNVFTPLVVLYFSKMCYWLFCEFEGLELCGDFC